MIGRLRTSAGRTFASLRNRNYRLFWLGQLVSNTGNWLANLALTLLVFHLTQSGVAVGALVATAYGPFLLISAWAGALADRLNKRRMLMLTQALEMAQSIVLSILAFLPHPPVPALFITALAGGILLAVDNPVRRSFVSELVEVDLVANAVVLYSALIMTSLVIGPSLAGLLVGVVGYGWCFFINAMSYLVVLLALALIRSSELRSPPVVAAARGQIRAGMRYVIDHRPMRLIFVMMPIGGLFVYRWETTFPLMFKDGLSATDGQFTVGFATFAFGALVGALACAHRGTPTLRRIIGFSFATSFTVAALCASPNLAVAYPAAFLAGVASMIAVTSTTAFVQVHVEPGVQGRVLALQAALLFGGAPIGAPILGLLSDAFGGRTPLATSAVAALISSGVAAVMATRSGDNPAAAAISSGTKPADAAATMARSSHEPL